MNVRSLFAVALAAILVPAAASAAPRSGSNAPAPSQMSGSPMGGGLSIGGFVGYETDDLSGISLRVDGEMPFGALSPQVNLSFVGSLGLSHLTEDLGLGEASANILKIVPAARLSMPLNPKFTLFADGGLGLYYSSWTIETPAIANPFYDPFDPFSGPQYLAPGGEIDDSEIGLMMRLGVGAWLDVNPKTRIGGSLEFNPYFGDVIAGLDQNTFLIQVGAMFRM